ncbi:MAG TPA: hypothetical protein DEF79_08970 [Gammaproteobacteria bacterium]|nr:hypothetical protein [Gammaproteobacteria bacterium]|tara:strand:- start:1336 stop:2520 length:1185 start_codon:yes stop_codon:yes gene_type:complete
MILQHRQAVLTLALAFLVSACATHTVKTTSYTPVVQDSQDLPEDFLLDVGVSLFDPGIDEYLGDDEDTANPEIRVAESRYAPHLLSETLQRSANWGIVRVMPNSESPMDVQVNGTILRSNGEAMIIRVEVNDSRGRHWYTEEYEEVISQFSYDSQNRQKNDPFQVIYNKIANDLLAYRQRNIEASEVQEIRTVSELLFAQRFSDDAFGTYLARDRNGEYQLTALPADNDPLLGRIRSIRERDFMFIDTVQDYFATYVRQMRLPYDSWREQSYQETITLRELEASARRRFIAGAAAVVGGIAAASNGGNWATQAGGATAVGAGAFLVKSGFDKQAEARIHMQALEELGESLENAVAPQVITLDDRTITLSGSVEEQYEQWRDILAELYATEMGEL